ncbi:MAG: HYR domain-containing protein [Bacteroidia bacterium]
MLRFLKPTRAFFLLCLFSLIGYGQSLYATHFVGGEITYRYISGTTYEVTMKYYRDCDGANFSNTEFISISPSINGNSSFSVTEVSRTDITPVGPGGVSSCQGGTIPGTQEIVYQANISFPALTGGQTYTISNSSCCRNSVITTGSADGSWYISTILDPNLTGGNTSPEIIVPPVTELCVGQTYSFPAGAFDPDGDFLQYSIAPSLAGPNSPVNYNGNLSPTNPLFTNGGVSIDRTTGVITFQPSQIQIGVLALKVEEFRNGVKIGEVSRDIQVIVKSCANVSPVVNAPTTVNATVGTPVSFNATATDANFNDIVTLTANADPAVTLSSTVTGTNPVNGSFSWTPGPADAGKVFSVVFVATDNASPTTNVNYATTNIVVTAANCSLAVNGVIAVVTDAVCNPTGSITLNIAQAQLPLNTVLWTGPNGFTSNQQNISNLSKGDYDVVVRDGRGCLISKRFFIRGDSVAPVITNCPADQTITLGPGDCDATFSYPALTYTDNCPAVPVEIQILGLPSGASYPDGTTVNTIILEDEGRNRDTCTFSVTVNDPTPLVINCPPDQAVYLEVGECDAIVTYQVNFTDNCPPASLQIQQLEGLASGFIFPEGITKNKFTVTDVRGNTDTCTFDVTVKDTIPLVINCPPDQTVYLEAGACDSVINYQVSYTDNCPPGAIQIQQLGGEASGISYPPGIVLNRFAVEDNRGNGDTCGFEITVLDTFPSLICPPSKTVDADQNCSAVVTYKAPIINNDCSGSGGSILITEADPNSPDALEIQNLANASTDYSGYIAVISSSYTDINTFNATFWQLGTFGAKEIKHRTDATNNNYWGNNMFWNSSSPSWAMIIDPQGNIVDAVFWGWDAAAIASFNANINGFPITIPTSTWSGDGISGSCSGTNSRSRQGTSDNNDASDWACIARTTGNANPGFTPPNEAGGGAGGGSANSPMLFSGLSSGSNFPLGVNTVGWAWEDAALGLKDTCYFNIEVQDMEPPVVASCPTASIFTCENSIVTYSTPTFTDNCGGTSITGTLITGQASGTVFPLGTNTVSYGYTDPSGNMEVCNFDVVVSGPVQAPNRTIQICSNALVGFDLQDHVDTNGNGVQASFSWVANAVGGVTGISTSPQTGSVIMDQLVNTSPRNRTVVYTVTPASLPLSANCAPSPTFTIRVVVRPATTIPLQILPMTVCPNGGVNVAAAVRDFSLRATEVRFFDADPNTAPANMIGSARMFRGTARTSDRVMVYPTVTTTYWVTGVNASGCGQTYSFDVIVQSCAVNIAPIAILEGAFDASANGQRTSLQQSSLVPSTEPYTNLGYTFVGGGGETINLREGTVPSIVDWVVIELRDATDATRIVNSRAALILSNGQIVDTDGVSQVTMSADASLQYYVAVIHRNHLGVMTAAPVSMGTTIDFSDPNLAVYGSNSRLVQNGKAMLFAGDADGNGQVQNTDDVMEWAPKAGSSGYESADYNLDGQVQNTDRVFIWTRNVGRGTAIPR